MPFPQAARQLGRGNILADNQRLGSTGFGKSQKGTGAFDTWDWTAGQKTFHEKGAAKGRKRAHNAHRQGPWFFLITFVVAFLRLLGIGHGDPTHDMTLCLLVGFLITFFGNHTPGLGCGHAYHQLGKSLVFSRSMPWSLNKDLIRALFAPRSIMEVHDGSIRYILQCNPIRGNEIETTE